jgi:hypothetical protein
MNQSTFARQLLFAVAGTAIGVALYAALAPIMAQSRYQHADFAYLLYLYANFMLWWVLGAREARLAVALFWMFFAYIVMLPAYFQIHEGFTWQAKDQARNSDVVLGSLLIVLVGFLATTAGQILGGAIRPRAAGRPRRYRFQMMPIAIVIAGTTVVALGLATFLGLEAFMMRRVDLLHVDWDSGGDRGIYFVFPRALAAYGLLMYIAIAKEQLLVERRMPFIWLAAIGVVVLPINAVINYPLALPRFWFFGILLAIFLTFIPLRNVFLRLGFFVSFIVMFVLVMPIADELTRGVGDTGIVHQVGTLQAIYNYMISPDLNQLPMIMNVYYYTEKVGYTYGNQLLSALFFFVPRIIWPGKSIGTGWLVGDEAGYDFLVLSEPIYGEFYIDGGFALLLIASLALGWFMVWIDRRFNQAVDDRDEPTRLWIAVYLGMSIMIYRGALLGVSPPIMTLWGLVLVSTIFLTRPAGAPAGSPAAAPGRPKLAHRWTSQGLPAPAASSPPRLGWSRPLPAGRS